MTQPEPTAGELTEQALKATRHLTPGDFYGCDFCCAMGPCDCKARFDRLKPRIESALISFSHQQAALLVEALEEAQKALQITMTYYDSNMTVRSAMTKVRKALELHRSTHQEGKG